MGNLEATLGALRKGCVGEWRARGRLENMRVKRRRRRRKWPQILVGGSLSALERAISVEGWEWSRGKEGRGKPTITS